MTTKTLDRTETRRTIVAECTAAAGHCGIANYYDRCGGFATAVWKTGAVYVAPDGRPMAAALDEMHVDEVVVVVGIEDSGSPTALYTITEIARGEKGLVAYLRHLYTVPPHTCRGPDGRAIVDGAR